jgi:hypothetical protein
VSGNVGSQGSLYLDGGVLETGKVAAGNGTSSFAFNGGTLRANADNTNFVGGFSTITLSTNGGIIDTNGKNVSVNSAFSGTGTLTKINSGTLTLNAASIGGLAHNAGTITIADNINITISGNTTIATGSTLRFGSNSGLDTAALTLNEDAHIVLNPLVSVVHIGILDLDSLNGGKVGISILDFQGLGEGELLEVFTFDTPKSDYGMDFAAEGYFTFENGDESYMFSWNENNDALLLTHAIPVPEPATYAMGITGSLILLGLVRRRKR